jgi:hypothetical protein
MGDRISHVVQAGLARCSAAPKRIIAATTFLREIQPELTKAEYDEVRARLLTEVLASLVSEPKLNLDSNESSSRQVDCDSQAT